MVGKGRSYAVISLVWASIHCESNILRQDLQAVEK